MLEMLDWVSDQQLERCWLLEESASFCPIRFEAPICHVIQLRLALPTL